MTSTPVLLADDINAPILPLAHISEYIGKSFAGEEWEVREAVATYTLT